MHVRKTLLLSLCMFGLVACGQTLEYSNAEIVNGKLYRAGEDKPFSGVATNVPLDKFKNKSVANYQSALAIYVNLNSPQYGGVDRSDFKHYPNMYKQICTGSFDDGEPEGEFKCMGSDGSHTEFEFEVGGDGDTDFIAYSKIEDGSVVVRAPYKNHKLHGEFTVYSQETGKPLFIAPFVEGRIQGQVIAHNAETGALVETFQAVNGRKDGEEVIYYNDGKAVKIRRQYKNGTREGKEVGFYDDGISLLYEANIRDGVQDGLTTEYYKDGSVSGKYTYRMGVVISMEKFERGESKVADVGATAQETSVTSDESTDACVDAWINAHRAVVGEDAVIIHDQIVEWEDFCKKGEMPPPAETEA